MRDVIQSNKVAAPAKAGAIAPINVRIPAINTGLGPEKTSFFQALAIPTKITRGTIELLVGVSYSFHLPFFSLIIYLNFLQLCVQSEVHLIKKDEKVGASEATLLNMLKIYPFSYGLHIHQGKLQGHNSV